MRTFVLRARAAPTDSQKLLAGVGQDGAVTVEGHVVFAFLDAFETDTGRVEQLKAHYRRGGLGDSTLKSELEDRLQSLIAPIRERRARLGDDRSTVLAVLAQGTRRGRERAASTLDAVKRALGLAYFA